MTLIWGDSYGGSFASSYKVEMSNDEVEWDLVYSIGIYDDGNIDYGNLGDGGVDDFWLDQIDWEYDSSPGIGDWFPKKYKYVRLTCIDAPGGSEYELREYRLTFGNRYPHCYASEAWERQDNTSPDEGYKYCANMVIDGNLTDESPDICSRWASGNSAVLQWFYVDMGSVQTFNELKIHWHNSAACDDYYIYGSQDGRVWHELIHKENTTGDIDVIVLPEEANARFVKINFQSIMNYAYSIVEMYIIPGAIATSSWSYTWGDEVPFKALDGNLDTAWCSEPYWGNWPVPPEEGEEMENHPENEHNQSITIDYGSSGKTFDTVVLNWTDCYAKEYKLEISETLDNPTWETIKTVTDSDGDADVIYLPYAYNNVKYLRVNLIDWGIDRTFYGIREIVAEMKNDFPVIDYESQKDFNKVIIKWNDLTDVESFRILTSDDQVNWTVRHTKDNVGKGLTVLPVGTISAQYLKIECKKSGIWTAPWSCMIGEVVTFLEYPCEIVSPSQTGYEGYKAMDGDLDTTWRSVGAGEQTFELVYGDKCDYDDEADYENDMEDGVIDNVDVTKFCFVTLIWGDSYASSYTIEAYNPALEPDIGVFGWNEVYSTINDDGDGGTDDFWLEIGWYDPDDTDSDWNYVPVQYSKFRLKCTQPGGGSSYYEIRELRVTMGSQYPMAFSSETWKDGDLIDNADKRWQYCPGFIVNGGLDGDYSRWMTGTYAQNQWVYIDFGKDRTFDEMDIFWYEDHGCDSYAVSWSQDGKNWTPIASNRSTPLDNNEDLFSFTETTARFLKLQMNGIVNRPYAIEEMYIIPGVLGTSCRTDEWGPQVPYKAMDEDLTTCWSSIPPWGNWGYIPENSVLDNQSITIDYGYYKNTFNTVIMQWDNGHAKTYSLKISDDLETWTTIYPTGTPILEDGATDLIKLDTDKTARYLKVCCTKRKNDDSNYTIQEVITELWTRYPIATAGSEASGHSASDAVDDSDSTYWSSTSGGTQWITLDNGALRQFDKVRLLWGSTNYASSYRIHISNNNENWEQIYSTTSGNGYTDTINLSQFKVARYVKLEMTQCIGSVYTLYDFSIDLSFYPARMEGKQLTINGQPFFSKGVCYGATPVGQNHNYDWSDDEPMYTTDMQLLQTMGCNVIRLYKPPLYSAGMDAAYEHGIYALMGYDITQGSDITDGDVRASFKEHFLQMVRDWKDHPAVFMWAIANEMNVHVPEADKPDWYSLVNECAAAAKVIDPFRPVTTVGVEVGDIAATNMGAEDSDLPAIDVWSVNIYRGQYFWNVFAIGEWDVWTDKPMLIAEFGCDAYHHWLGEEYQTPQAEYSRNWWVEMIANSTALNPDKFCLGGTLFQFADDWNKQKAPTIHDEWPTGFCGNLYDSVWGFNDEGKWIGFPNWEDEWAGIVGIAPDTCEKDLREAYFSLQEVWAAETNSDNFATDTQSSYVWYGDSHTYDSTNDWINTFAGSGSSGYVSMVKALNHAEVSVQTDFCFTNTNNGQGAIRAFVRTTPGFDPGTKNGYCAVINADDGAPLYASLYRINNGVWTQLQTSNINEYYNKIPKPGEWHTIRLSVRDRETETDLEPTLTLFLDGSWVVYHIDESPQKITSAGDVAIQPINGDVYIDNYFAMKCGYGIRFEEPGTRDLVAYYPMHEDAGNTVLDYSGIDNHGTKSGPTWTTYGMKGDALSFDGINDYVDCGNPSSLNLDGNSFSIELWAKFDNFNGVRGLISKNGSYTFNQSLHIVMLNSSLLRFGFYANDLDLNKSFDTGKWYYFVCTYDVTNNQRKIYVDGVEEVSNIANGPLVGTNGAKLEIGRIYSRFNEAMDGMIDEVRIYNRALGEEEILAKYESMLGPIALWHFDEAYGDVAKDDSGNHNDGNIYDATWVSSKFDSALSFNGIDNYVDCGNDLSLNLDENSFSVGLWAKFDNFNGERGLIGKNGSFAPNKDLHIVMKNSSLLRFGFYANDLDLNKSFNTNTWYYLVFTYDFSNNQRKIYVDAVEEASNIANGPLAGTNGAKLEIGRIHTRFSEAMDGIIDEVKIYNRVLSIEEIEKEYNSPITIRALGTGVNVEPPIMELWINGDKVESWTVTNTSYQDFIWYGSWDSNSTIDVVFANDNGAGGVDTNMCVNYIVIDGETVQSEADGVIYDRAVNYPNECFDGVNVIAGQEWLPWTGALRFNMGTPITIRAYGTGVNVEPPIMELWIDGDKVESWTVTNTSYQDFIWYGFWDSSSTIDVVFVNDNGAGGVDTNIVVDYIVIDGETVQSESDGVIYDRGGCFDGVNVIAGQEWLPWTGALRFNMGKNIIIRAYGTGVNVEPPIMDLWINGDKVESWTVTNTSYQNFIWYGSWDSSSTIDVVFVNDNGAGGVDTNIRVDYIAIDGETVQSEADGVIYDRAVNYPDGCFDGVNVIAGQEWLCWYGALRFWSLQPTATASSVEPPWIQPDEDFSECMAIDRDMGTRWSSKWNVETEWIFIDFKAPKNFNTIKLYWEKTAVGRQYKIQISDNGSNWTTIYTETNSNGGTDEIFVGEHTAQYVKMQGVNRGAGHGYSLYEFLVFK